MKILSTRARAKEGSRAEVLSELSLKSDIAELRRCSFDPVYFISKYVKIFTAEGSVPCILTKVQEKLVRTSLEFQKLIVQHPRQAGITTGMLGFLLWEALFHGDRRTLIVAPNEMMKKHMLEMLYEMYHYLPKILKAPMLQQNKTGFELDNFSSIEIKSASSSNVGRGTSYSTLYFSDLSCDKALDQERLFFELMPQAIGAQSKIIVSGVPSSHSASERTLVFNKLCEQAEITDDAWKILKITGSEVHGAQLEHKYGEYLEYCGKAKADAEILGIRQ